MRKSAVACAIRAASPVPNWGAYSAIDDILDAGLLADAPEIVHQIDGSNIYFDRFMRIGRETFRVANLASRRVEYEDDSTPIMCCLVMDEGGRFYGLEMQEGPDVMTNPKVLARLEDGKQAMVWISKHLVCNHAMKAQFVRAVENPAFEFMPMVPEGPKRRKRRQAKKSARLPLAVQLEMATALVGMIQKLEADPRPETLADGRAQGSLQPGLLHRGLSARRGDTQPA
jgi:hypothetical protein